MKKDNSTKNKKIYTITFIISLILLFLIELYQYSLNFNVRKQPPSPEWSKEVPISQGDVRTTPKLIKLNNAYYVAHDDAGKVKVLIVDNKGSVIKTKTLEAGFSIVKELNLLTDGTNIYVNWLIDKLDSKSMYTVKLDRDLNEVEKFQTNGVSSSYEVNKNILLFSTDDKVEYLNVASGKSLSLAVNKPLMLSGYNTSKGLLVTYINADSKYDYFFINNDVASTAVPTNVTGNRDTARYANYALFSDGTKCYILQQYTSRGQADPKPTLVTFPLERGAKEDVVIAALDDLPDMTNLSIRRTDGEISFIATAWRIYGKNTSQSDIAEFRMSGNKVSKMAYVSRTREGSLFPYSTDDAAVYCDLMSQDSFKVYISSQNQEFKNSVNGIRSYEKKEALIETIEFMAYSLGMLVISALVWIFPGLAFVSVLSFFNWAMKDKTKKVMYVLVYLATAAIKTSYFYGKLYKELIPGRLPALLSNTYAGLAICALISVFALFFGYIKYTDDIEDVPAISFLIALGVDSVLTLTLFYPFF